MLKRKPILIVEDEPLIAMGLVHAVEDYDGKVVGPVPTVSAALALIENEPIFGAVLDANLADRDITPVALKLAERGIPFVVHTAVGLPSELAAALPSVPVILKPDQAHVVLDRLIRAIFGR